MQLPSNLDRLFCMEAAAALDPHFLWRQKLDFVTPCNVDDIDAEGTGVDLSSRAGDMIGAASIYYCIRTCASLGRLFLEVSFQQLGMQRGSRCQVKIGRR